jgi:hypothetical protein
MVRAAPKAPTKKGAAPAEAPPAAAAQPPPKRAKTEPGAGEITAQDQKALLSAMSYYAKCGSEGAVEAQKVWGALPVAERKKFFDTWVANRDDKAQKSSFRWVHTLTKEVRTVASVSNSSNQAMRHGGEILGFAGLRWSDFPTPADGVKAIERLVAKNQAEHPGAAFDPPQLDEEMPMLSRWSYIRDSGTDTQVRSESSQAMASQSQVSEQQAQGSAQQVLNLEQGSAQGGEPADSPQLEKFKAVNKHLASLVQALRKAVGQAEDVECRLEVASKRDPCLATKAAAFKARLAQERAWTQAAGVAVQEWAWGEGRKEEDLDKEGAEQEKLTETAAAKLDAIRQAVKDVSKFL